MNKLLMFLGVLVIVLGLAFLLGGVYFGFVTCLIGGIIEVINQIKADEINSSKLTWAVVGIIFFQTPIIIGIYGGIFLIGLGVVVGFGEDGKFERNYKW